MSSDEQKVKDWLFSKVTQLKKISDSINVGEDKDATNLTYDKGGWTVLKLVCLRYILSIYSTIIGNQEFKNMVYLDLLSGSGLNRIDGKYEIIGSSIIAANVPNAFNKLIFVERSPSKTSILQKRLEHIIKDKERYKIITSDCNDIENILTEIPQEAHVFSFVDNEGFDTKWATIEKLLNQRKGDILINFPTTGFSRTEGYVSSDKSRNPEKAEKTVNQFMEEQEWQGKTPEAILEGYTSKISSLRSIVIPIKIQRDTPQGYHYHLLYATRKTPGGSPWVPAIEDLKKKVEALSGKDVEIILPIIAGEQRIIDAWNKKPQRNLLEYQSS